MAYASQKDGGEKSNRTFSKTDANEDSVKETEKQSDQSVCLEKSREDNVMVNLGRKRIRMEFGNPQCQILQREQRPVAFGLVVSFLFSLLPRKDGDKKRERSWKTPSHHSHLFSNQSTGSQGKGRRSHNVRASLGTWSVNWISFMTSLAHTPKKIVTAIYLGSHVSRIATLPAWFVLAARCFARCSRCEHAYLFPENGSFSHPNSPIFC